MLSENFSQRQWAYLVTLGGSLIFSIVAIMCEPYLNNDGIFYIDAANVYLREGITRSLESYPWPFYSILIAVLHQVSGLPLQWAAHVINTVLISLTGVLFLRIYSEITRRRGNFWIACILILNLVGINKFRDDVMRDFGYWCFVMVGFLSYLKYLESRKMRIALAWQLSMLIAFLFRIEAVALMLLAPLAVYSRSGGGRDVIAIMKLYLLYGLFIAASGIYFLSAGKGSMDLSSTRMKSILTLSDVKELVVGIHQAVLKMGAIFWYDGTNLDKNYALMLILLLVSMALYATLKIAFCMSIPYAMVTLYGMKKRLFELNYQNRIVIYFILIQSLVVILFLSQKFFIVPRYATVLVLFLLLITCQIVEKLYVKINHSKWRKTVFIGVIVVLGIQTGDTLITFSGYRKSHIVEAGRWSKDHIPTTYPLLSNDLKAVYYADRHYLRKSEIATEIIVKKIETGQFPKGTHLIIDGKDEEREDLLRQLEYFEAIGKIMIMKQFTNTDNDWVVVTEVMRGDGGDG